MHFRRVNESGDPALIRRPAPHPSVHRFVASKDTTGDKKSEDFQTSHPNPQHTRKQDPKRSTFALSVLIGVQLRRGQIWNESLYELLDDPDQGKNKMSYSGIAYALSEV